jgi:hypothetical protein
VEVGAALPMTTHLQGCDRAPFLDPLENLGASGLEPEVGLCLQARASARMRVTARFLHNLMGSGPRLARIMRRVDTARNSEC